MGMTLLTTKIQWTTGQAQELYVGLYSYLINQSDIPLFSQPDRGNSSGTEKGRRRIQIHFICIYRYLHAVVAFQYFRLQSWI
jgi:hypothetical protein